MVVCQKLRKKCRIPGSLLNIQIKDHGKIDLEKGTCISLVSILNSGSAQKLSFVNDLIKKLAIGKTRSF